MHYRGPSRERRPEKIPERGRAENFPPGKENSQLSLRSTESQVDKPGGTLPDTESLNWGTEDSRKILKSNEENSK